LGKRKNRKFEWEVQPCFKIGLHSRDKELYKIKSFIGEIGNVVLYGTMVYYKVYSLYDNINIIIPHFEKFPLIT